MRPIIALTADTLDQPSPELNVNHADYAPRDIKNAIIKAGGMPVILPFPEDVALAAEMAQAAAATFDGLLLPGGPDVDPTLYGEEPSPAIGSTEYPKDRFEQALIRATITAGKPILAICRGLQILNVTLGGTLYQDLASQDPDVTIRHAQAAPGQYPTHHVTIKAGSQLARLVGEHAYVNSRHHEAVKRVAPGLQVMATAPDGVIEALADLQDRQVMAVQWHPENLWQQDAAELRPFALLVQRAEAHATAQSSAAAPLVS